MRGGNRLYRAWCGQKQERHWRAVALFFRCYPLNGVLAATPTDYEEAVASLRDHSELGKNLSIFSVLTLKHNFCSFGRCSWMLEASVRQMVCRTLLPLTSATFMRSNLLQLVSEWASEWVTRRGCLAIGSGKRVDKPGRVELDGDTMRTALCKKVISVVWRFI